MYKVGITGGIGSGKSVVCNMLRQRDIAIYDCDKRAKELMASDRVIVERLVERFGAEVFANGELNRAYLAERVFSDAEALAALNGIVHPRVAEDFERWASEAEGEYVVLESAILFESGFDSKVDVVVAIMAPEELRLEREPRHIECFDNSNLQGTNPVASCVVFRDGKLIEERMRNQLSDDERCHRAKYAIVNIELDELEEDVEQLHRRLSYDAKSFSH